MRLPRNFIFLGLSLFSSLTGEQACTAAAPPNIVYILCDDLGYGDVRCLNPQGKIATPVLDRLASQGMTFTDAHSGSSVCTPTRYGILTGRYAWRSRLKRDVLGGLSPRLIEPGRMTVASFLKQHGYHTACIGKWHLGMNWARLAGKQVNELGIESRQQADSVDYSRPISDGPLAVGFDEFFGISASLDMVPYTYIENDHVTALPAGTTSYPMMLGNDDAQTRPGPAAPGFDVSQVLPTLARKAVEYVDRRAAAARRGEPFFLYLPLTTPHTPIAPTPEWRGKSGLNPYGDFVMQTDASIGQVLEALDKNGLADNTLVVVTSDNGCAIFADIDWLVEHGHHPSYHFRGQKADIYEGGHRMPFFVRWPGNVAPGSQTDAVVCHTDLLATCCDILGAKLPENAGEDSVSLLPVLLGQPGPRHEAVVHHSAMGAFAIRKGPWKLALWSGGGAWRADAGDLSRTSALQLYNLADDASETTNLYESHPEIVKELTALLEQYVADGRSTPGAPQANTTPVDIRAIRNVKYQPQPAGKPKL